MFHVPLPLVVPLYVPQYTLTAPASAAWSAKVNLGGGKTFSLTGTYDEATKTLSISGGGYTLTGTLTGSTLSGTYTGPNGAGSVATTVFVAPAASPASGFTEAVLVPEGSVASTTPLSPLAVSVPRNATPPPVVPDVPDVPDVPPVPSLELLQPPSARRTSVTRMSLTSRYACMKISPSSRSANRAGYGEDRISPERRV